MEGIQCGFIVDLDQYGRHGRECACQKGDEKCRTGDILDDHLYDLVAGQALDVYIVLRFDFTVEVFEVAYSQLFKIVFEIQYRSLRLLAKSVLMVLYTNSRLKSFMPLP